MRNRCSDINFNSYYADAFTVGVEGSREGVIINIGKSADLQKKYGYEETVGNGQGFASIRLSDRKILILGDRKTRTTQEFIGAESLFSEPTSKSNTAPVRVGDIYLMRLTDPHDKDYEIAAKLIVIAHVTGESVTFRWQVL